MIRKFLVCGKHLFLSSKKLEDVGATKIPNVELLLPIHLFWEVERLLKDINYLTAANEDPVEINDLNTKVLKKVAPYVVYEKDRTLVNERVAGTTQKEKDAGG